MAPRWRDYDEARDLAAVARTWRECGWIDGSEEQAAGVRAFFAGGDAVVLPAGAGGDAECAVHRTLGTVRHGVGPDAVDLPLNAVTGVTTSRIARGRGLAAEGVVEALARGVDDGAAVAMLGAFEIGFYDRFGFGTGPYEHSPAVDPATLVVPVPDRAPVRLGRDDLGEVHELLGRRLRAHGGVALTSPGAVVAEWAWLSEPIGIGLRADDGRLTGALLADGADEHGPYEVKLLAYEAARDLLDLLGVLRSLGDQVRLVRFSFEPAEVHVQDLVSRPIRQRIAGRMAGGRHHPLSAVAWWQTRIVDLPACIAATPAVAEPVTLDLVLDDPVAVEAARCDGRWTGIGGAWRIELAPTSTAVRIDDERVGDDARPVLRADVNALSRWWSGSRTATSLALTDRFEAPPALLDDLDRAVRLPPPRPGLEF